MFEGNRICESSRAIQHLLEKYKPTEDDSNGQYVDYRTLIQARDVVAKHAKFPSPNDKKPRTGHRPYTEDKIAAVVKARQSGLTIKETALKTGFPIGTCKTILHRHRHGIKTASSKQQTTK